jgi:hypothetical protein
MIRKLIASTLLLAVVALAGGAGASAQTGPSVKPPVIPPPVVAKGMSEADLLKGLRTLDPNVLVRKGIAGTLYNLKVRNNGWLYDIQVEFYAGSIWVNVYLGAPVANMDKVPSSLLSQLLQYNIRFGPSHFAFLKQKDGRLQMFLCRNLERGPLTEAGLRKMIDAITKQARDSYPTWNAVLSAAK